MLRRLALVRRPSPRLAEGLVTHIPRSQHVDAQLAMRQWEGYCAAMRSRGWELLEAPPADEHPDAVFVEDQAFVYGDLAVMTRPGARGRTGEQDGLEGILTDHGYRIERISAPGTLEGGDVLKYDGRVWVGLGEELGRSNEAGIEQLRDLLAPMGATVEAARNTHALHLKSALTALPDGSFIGWAPVVDEPERWPGFIAAPEQPGGQVVLLGDMTILMSAAAPQTAELLRGRGMDVVTVDISEFEKLEGCVTCLSVRLRS